MTLEEFDAMAVRQGWTLAPKARGEYSKGLESISVREVDGKLYAQRFTLGWEKLRSNGYSRMIKVKTEDRIIKTEEDALAIL